jgi:PmbA protein
MLKHKNLKYENLELLTNTVKQALHFSKQNNVSCEVSANISLGLYVNVRNQEIDTIEFNNHQRLSITVYFNQHQGTVTTTEIHKQAIQDAILKAKSIAKFTNPDPYSGLADPKLMAKNFTDLDLYHPENIEPANAINTAKICEQTALSFNSAIKNSDGVIFNYTSNFMAIGNSNDFIAALPTTSYNLSCSVIAEEQQSMQRDYDFSVARCLQDLTKPETIGKKAALYAVSRLGAKKLSTRKTKVLFIPRVAINLLEYLIVAIDGSNISNKASFLLDHLNTKIFPDFINIIDDPFIKRGFASRTFDGDGIATKKQAIIADGILNTYLLNTYFARKLKSSPTGHASGINNLIINPSNPKLSYSDLIKKMHTGLIVTETIGHGVNLVTGDYSKGAFGFWVEQGKIAYPVEEITIAGNLKTMFKNILAVGTDVNYQNNIITGSILIDDLIVAGN